VWAPEVDASWGRASVAVTLVQSALNDLRGKGFRLAQALLDESSPRQGAADLTAGGMPHVTDLVYLEADTRVDLALRPGLPPIEWASYNASTDPIFRAVLHDTYCGSLDMPELEGLRSLDDVIASHRAGGRFVPERWLVGNVAGEPGSSAVLLLSEIHDRDAWEVAYLGLTPSARGRGLGRAVLSHALSLARPFASRLELAVDVRNTPARHLYTSAGLRPFDRRAVHLATLQ
jgi:GNAT superfamily N-acetyltransferase